MLKRIYQMIALNNFGLGLVTVFEPIYFLKLGYSFQTIMTWYLSLATVFIFSTFLVGWISNRIGLVRTFYIRFVLLLSYLSLLFMLPSHPQLLFPISILVGMEWAFYYIPLNTLFVRKFSNDTSGSDVSKTYAYPDLASLASPILGAVIITRFGFPVLFGIAMILVLVAVAPLLPLASERTNFQFRIIDFK